MKRLLVTLLVATLFGCASRVSQNTIVLDYSDFGPQAMSYKIIGPKRMPWAPDTPVRFGEGKIHVVVYRGISKDKVMEAYPVDQDSNIDYRYIAHGDALRYLDANIARDILRKVTVRLEQTRSLLLNQLGAG